MSTPIEIVRAHLDARVTKWGTQADVDLDCALASVLADAERYKALELAHNHPGSPHYWWAPGESVFTPLAKLADRLREGAK